MSCHYNGGIAPFALTDYTTSYTHRYNIQHAVQTGRMPPWPPDTTYSRMVGERILTATERQKIIDWVNAGAPSGNLALQPPPPTFTTPYQLPGTPDLVVKIPPITSSATTTDQYVCVSVPSGLTQDRMIKAYEIVPGNPSIVHHAIVTGDTTNSFPPGMYDNCFTTAQDVGIGGYAPGQGPTIFPSVYPAKLGILLPANTNIVFQLHFPAGSIGQVDSTQIRFFFYPINEPDVRQIYIIPLLQNWSLNIPPNTIQTYTNTCPSTGLFTNCQLPINISVFGAFPHSHLICTRLRNFAVNPFNPNDTIPLIRINRWDFHWQGFYTFKKLIKVPAGYKWYSYHTYDNTAANPNNPNNPPQTVLAGENTTDEMLFDSFMLLMYQSGDENINIDSLMTVSIKKFYSQNKEKSKIVIYPNPFSEWFYLKVQNSDEKILYVRITDISGKIIFEKTDDYPFIFLPNMEKGLYFAEVITSEGIYSVKIIKN
ncbi:MAG: T9SS type A sorting domain-containing protein [Bacteroidia bacterium]|nr:T9SS type A sorting domain-containing protein [Bacteroidia bacterium]